MKLLQILCKGSGFIVQDPSNVEMGKMAVDQETYHGLVLPVHVNDNDHMSKTTIKIHWVVAVVDWKVGKFTSVGMHEALAKQWITKFESLLKIQFRHDAQEASVRSAYRSWLTYR